MNETRGWISVKDRLPVSNCDVIVFTATEEIEIGNYTDSEWLTSSYGKVMYWMPLPKTPDGKSSAKQNTAYM